jgi:ribosome-associated translation inhibitor RaiA
MLSHHTMGENRSGTNSRMEIVFKNMERSELAREAVLERLDAVFSKFPFLETSRITVTVAMENSPQQAGPDLFSVTVQIQGLSERHFILSKSAHSLYLALAQLSDLLCEKLMRVRARSRVRSRRASPLNLQPMEADSPG